MTIQSNFPNLSPSLDLNFAATKTLSPLVTFTRASTATYYGTQTAKAEENLVLRSQEFDFAGWIKINATVTANATTAPDGTITADALIENTANSVHNVANSTAYSVSASVYTYSVFVKANGRSIAAINMFDGTNSLTWFDLSSGTVGTNAAGSTANINSVGDGWYRISVTRTLSATSNCYINIYPSTSDGVVTYTGDGTSGIFVWGAQLEQRSTATAYQATTTQPITNYIPVLQTALAGVPRFDHKPTTFESLGLLVEESRSNLFTYSDDFANAAWTKFRATIISNTIVAPDGTLNGDKLVEDTTASATHQIAFSNITITANTVLSQTIYAKAAERTFIRLWDSSSTTAWGAIFNLSNGTLGTVGAGATASIQSVGNNWYRCSITYTNTTTTARPSVGIANSSSTFEYTGDGYSGIYIWGAQLEAGAFPTSYIPTVASQVTRSADAASITGSNFTSFYNQAEGTFFVNGLPNRPYSASVGGQFLSAGISVSNRMWIAQGTTTNFVNVAGQVGGAGQFDMSTGGTLSANQQTFAVLAYKFNDVAVSANGSAASTDTTALIPNANTLWVGVGATLSAASTINGTIKRLAYYPARLTNAQLQALTS